MGTATRFVRSAALGLALSCVMLAVAACQRPAALRTPRQPAQRAGREAAARNRQILTEARRLVAESARKLDDKDLLSNVSAPSMAVMVSSRAIKADPEFSAAHRVLGRGLLEQARFGEAAAAFRRTLQLDPRDRTAARELAESQRLAELARSLPLRLKPGQRLLALVETEQASRARVFAVIGSRKQFEHLTWYVGPEAKLFTFQRDRYRETFRTTRVAWEKADEVNYYRVWVADLLGMGRAQIVLVSGWSGADHYRQVLDVFLPQGDSLRHIVHVAGVVPGGDPPFEVKDLDMDGRREIEVSELVAYAVANAATWRDVFEYDGGRYRLATSRFPSIVRDNVADLESFHKFCLQEFGHADDRVLEYLARGRRYLRDSEKAPLTTRRHQR